MYKTFRHYAEALANFNKALKHYKFSSDEDFMAVRLLRAETCIGMLVEKENREEI